MPVRNSIACGSATSSAPASFYLVNQAKFVAPEQIDVTHILFDPVKRGKDAALASAVDARAKIVAGADFGALAQASSDDPSGAKEQGPHRRPHPGQDRIPPSSEAAFALRSPATSASPVLAPRFGYHVIRLEDRKPARQKSLVEAQQQIVAEMRLKHIQEAREAVVMAIRSDSRVQVDQEAVDALVLKVDYPALPQRTPPRPRRPRSAPSSRGVLDRRAKFARPVRRPQPLLLSLPA